MISTFSPLDGALLIDKPVGPTSHDVVAGVRRQFALKKVGHCGTLDPNATGLLILVLGKATRLSDRLMSDDKTYEGTLKLGETTTTYDADGELAHSLPVPLFSLPELQALADSFLGDQMQLPPMVSAVKQAGVPLYKLARKGIEVERKERFIHIYTFQLQHYQEPIAHFRVSCTKGTYVRSLVHDFGRKAGCGAHLASLRRLVSGKFSVDQAHPLDHILSLSTAELEKRVIPILKLAELARPTSFAGS